MTTWSTPSSVRAIWAWMVTRPWPTSAAAVCTVTAGSPATTPSRTRAVEWSSNPSEKPTFLMPMAYPTPRATPSPCVALDTRAGRQGRVPHPAEQFGDGRRRVDHLPGRHDRALGHRVADPELHRVQAGPAGTLVHLRLVGEAGLDGAEAAHRPARRVVGVRGVH